MRSPVKLLRYLSDLLFPARCAYCRSSAGNSPVPHFCTSCWSDLAPLQGPVCPSCGRPFASPFALSASPEHECSGCRKDPPHYDQALAAGLFEGPLREAVHLFKYRPVQALGRPLADWMTNRVRLVEQLDIVLPVPLHRKRLRHRGFNQAVVLGHRLAEHYCLPFAPAGMARIRHTRPQVDLPGAERTANVRNAFAVPRADLVEGKRILLIDDVFTTGATMNECARVLREAGARSVFALTLARAAD